MAPSLARISRDQKGYALAWALVFILAVSLVIVIMPGLFRRSFKDNLDDQRRFLAQMLANDLKEVGKYLLLYERVFYTQNPLSFDAAIRSLWGQSFNSVDPATGLATNGLLDACGGFELSGKYTGSQKLNGQMVFCPVYYRSHILDGTMLEELLFENWSDGTLLQPKPMTTTGDGHYLTEVEMSASLDNSSNAGDFLRLTEGNDFAKVAYSAGTQAKVTYDFFTDSAGFKSMLSERYVKVTAELQFDMGDQGRVAVRDAETLMVVPSSPKDFALFLPFPTKATGEDTDKFSEAVIVSPQTVFHGRVYFNGDLDAPRSIDDFPFFEEAVIISGKVTVAGKIPGPLDLPKLKSHFKKGIVTHFSSYRYLLNGDCTGMTMESGSGMDCTPAPGLSLIKSYISKLNSALCAQGNIDVEGSLLKYSAGSAPADCEDMKGPDGDVSEVIRDGYYNVNVKSPTLKYAYIMSPVAKLDVQDSDASIYGLVLGGHVRTNSNARNHFYSLANLRTGLPGIGSDTTLAKMNAQAVTANGGVFVPLLNLPVVYSGKDAIGAQ